MILLAYLVRRPLNLCWSFLWLVEAVPVRVALALKPASVWYGRDAQQSLHVAANKCTWSAVACDYMRVCLCVFLCSAHNNSPAASHHWVQKQLQLKRPNKEKQGKKSETKRLSLDDGSQQYWMIIDKKTYV